MLRWIFFSYFINYLHNSTIYCIQQTFVYWWKTSKLKVFCALLYFHSFFSTFFLLYVHTYILCHFKFCFVHFLYCCIFWFVWPPFFVFFPISWFLAKIQFLPNFTKISPKHHQNTTSKRSFSNVKRRETVGAIADNLIKGWRVRWD